MVKNAIKEIIISVDSQSKLPVYKTTINMIEYWHNSNFLNIVRRTVNPIIIRWKYKIRMRHRNPLKLHLGCGNQHLEDYENIDLRKTWATNLVCDIKKLPYPDNSVALIETYHVIEHIPRHDLPNALKEWYRLLIQGGKLIIECPDFDEDVKEYIEGNEKRMDSIFGLQRFPGDTHLFGYNFKTLKQLLETSGFKEIQRKEPKDYHAKNEPCLRIEGTRL